MMEQSFFLLMFASVAAVTGYAVWRLVVFGARVVVRRGIRLPAAVILRVLRLRWVVFPVLGPIIFWLIQQNALISAMVLLGVAGGVQYSLYAIRMVWNDFRISRHPPTLRAR